MIVEIDLYKLQNEKAQDNWGEFDTDQCILCGRKVGAKPLLIQYLTNGSITNAEHELENTQAFFPVGTECAKKVLKAFENLKK